MTTESIKDKAQFDHECDILSEEAALRLLQPGDLVRLRSGGPVMTLNSYTTERPADDLAVNCVWFVDRENVGKFANPVQSHDFHISALQRVGKDSGKDSGETRQAMEFFKDLGKGSPVVIEKPLPRVADVIKESDIEILGEPCKFGKSWRESQAKLADEAAKYADRGVYGVCVGYYDHVQQKFAPNFVVSHKPYTAEQLRELVLKARHYEVEDSLDFRIFVALRGKTTTKAWRDELNSRSDVGCGKTTAPA